MPATKLDLAKYLTDTFIETGTHVGDGVESALQAGFKAVVSMEVQQGRYKASNDRFNGDSRVTLIHGASEDNLARVLDGIHEPATIWLDAHGSWGVPNNTLLKELEIIKNHSKAKHTVLIDDKRMFESWGIDLAAVEQASIAIGPGYELSYEDGLAPDDVIVVKPKIGTAKIAVLMHSSDRGRFIWKLWLRQWQRFFRGKVSHVFVSSENIPCTEPGVTSILTGECQWGESLIRTLAEIKRIDSSVTHVLYCHEDHVLTGDVSAEWFGTISGAVETLDADLIKLYQTRSSGTYTTTESDVEGIKRVSLPCPYCCSHQPSVWSMEYMGASLHKDQEPAMHDAIIGSQGRMNKGRVFIAAKAKTEFQYEEFCTKGELRPGLMEQLSKTKLIAAPVPVELPPVSCVCITAGRSKLLSEAIESFLRQDYEGETELVILNDLPQQRLTYGGTDDPMKRVRIVNSELTFCTVGEKRHASVALACHDVLIQWDDDDISLPHRISHSVKAIGSRRKAYYKQGKAWKMDNGVISGSTKNYYDCTCAFTREAYVACGGYTIMNSGQDVDLAQKMQKCPEVEHIPDLDPPDSELVYIYRWSGTGAAHLSGFGKDKDGSNGRDKMMVDTIRRINKKQEPEGKITIKAGWAQEYANIVSGIIHPEAEIITVENVVPAPQEIHLPPGALTKMLGGSENQPMMQPNNKHAPIKRPDKEIIEDTKQKILDHLSDNGGPWDALKDSLRVTEDAINLKGESLGGCWTKKQWKRIIDAYITVTKKEKEQ